jgi:hypothetical protein
LNGADDFGFDKGLLAYLKVGSRSLSAICRILVMFLYSRKLTAEFFVEFIRINNELASAL